MEANGRKKRSLWDDFGPRIPGGPGQEARTIEEECQRNKNLCENVLVSYGTVLLAKIYFLVGHEMMRKGAKLIIKKNLLKSRVILDKVCVTFSVYRYELLLTSTGKLPKRLKTCLQ